MLSVLNEINHPQNGLAVAPFNFSCCGCQVYNKNLLNQSSSRFGYKHGVVYNYGFTFLPDIGDKNLTPHNASFEWIRMVFGDKSFLLKRKTSVFTEEEITTPDIKTIEFKQPHTDVHPLVLGLLSSQDYDGMYYTKESFLKIITAYKRSYGREIYNVLKSIFSSRFPFFLTDIKFPCYFISIASRYQWPGAPEENDRCDFEARRHKGIMSSGLLDNLVYESPWTINRNYENEPARLKLLVSYIDELHGNKLKERLKDNIFSLDDPFFSEAFGIK